MTDIQRVKHFLNGYAVKFGVPLPGRLPNHRNLKVTLLPSDKTKADIFFCINTCAIVSVSK
jgi:hypothetical protein